MRGWRTDPPVHRLVRNYLGYKPPASAGKSRGPAPKPTPEESTAFVNELLAAFGGQVQIDEKARRAIMGR